MSQDTRVEKVITESVASDSNVVNRNSIVESKAKKERRKRSVAWDHFTSKVDSEGIKKGGKHLHVRCMAHIINLVVQDGIKEANISIERIRQAVRYIRQSPARWKNFQECCVDENLAKKSLCLDVPTRWNSTYLMLNRAIEYEGAILTYTDRDIGLAHHLEFGHICVCDGDGDSDIVDEEQPVGSLLCSD
ncbi:hypothetical protein CQW23_27960 [Capsicum baccatum]|uniref:Uncharacterized protein n=1 Tax=Capsicum baccatum TaxID=33114 RepID=A0A2G2VF74_CAPBA|nr:hypothetical protein CQW23_27960 [Capsicum baccatum]